MLFSDEQWAEIGPLLPTYKPSPKGGRPRLEKRKILEGIIYVSKNKIPWNAVPKVYGSGTALNDYFREWAAKGVFHKLKVSHLPLIFCLDWDRVESLNDSSRFYSDKTTSLTTHIQN